MQKYKYSGKKKRTQLRTKPFTRKGVLRWVLAVIFIGLFLIFFTGNKSLFRLYSLHKEEEKLQKQHDNLLQQNRELENEINNLKTDQKYLEKVAREKYNMKKEGEEIYVVEPEK
jgi:cell division protein DivIC